MKEHNEAKETIQMAYRKKQIRKSLGDMEISEGGVVTRLRGDDATLRALRDLGLVVNARVSRVWPAAIGESPDVSLLVGGRRIGLDDLTAGNVEVTVPRVYDTRPGTRAEDWRLRYAMNTR